MKIIDLLNKIANGEKVPKKIKYEEKEWIYGKNVQDYIYEKDIEIKYLIQTILNGYRATKDLLFYEVEIIEEEKDIEKIDKWNENIIRGLRNDEEVSNWQIKNYISVLMGTQNQIIDEVNKLKKGTNK